MEAAGNGSRGLSSDPAPVHSSIKQPLIPCSLDEENHRSIVNATTSSPAPAATATHQQRCYGISSKPQTNPLFPPCHWWQQEQRQQNKTRAT
ncbi:hypothetical protein OPV22_025479 [Ensete ventricosum]|uniref:Uncharacterized protein n=1 Tax=Ensete ventricosum TaxID=4639 RepID=A0AAV8P7J4_ENSVE|nr:hypothetical protein OPV22_025479 [Ensete ventricosum]